MSAVLGTTAADGTMVAVYDLGGHGRPALLVHAAGFLAQVLAPLASELDGAIASWAPDLRGHGCSGAPPGDNFAWGGFALDVIASARLVADEIDMDAIPRYERLVETSRVQLLGIGHSVGATALLLAEASRPGTFSALYCYEPILVPAGERQPIGTPNPLAEAARRRTATFSSRTVAADRYQSSRALSRLDPKVLAAYVAHGFADCPDGSVTLRCLPDHEALVYENGMASDAFDRLGDVRCPVTVAVGTSSLDRGRASAPAVVAALPDARLVEVEQLGHLGPLESPAEVAASVLDAFGTPTA
ncbi:MAG: alpha/beta fold hydrolase [Acidimicrobiales bacterium]